MEKKSENECETTQLLEVGWPNVRQAKSEHWVWTRRIKNIYKKLENFFLNSLMSLMFGLHEVF